ncbi:MAG: exodeoxyribonuclease V subunit beta [Desulfotalea sp.]
MTKVFDAAKTPIEQGFNFIEASAGTGKTYTIAMLVLRGITEKELDIGKILIVTFTNAAAKELSSRIRDRLVEAKLVLEGRLEGDPTLARWAEGIFSDEERKGKYIRLLQLAIVDIDRAAIFTIHGFCQRMLADLALESGQLFNLDLVADLSSIKTEATRDFWRLNVYSLPAWQCSVIMNQWDSPEKLTSCLVDIKNRNIVPETDSLDVLWDKLDKQIGQFKTWWQGGSQNLLEELKSACNELKFKKDFCDNYISRWHAADDFISGKTLVFPETISQYTYDSFLKEVNGNKFRGKKSVEKEPFANSFSLPNNISLEIDALLSQLSIAFRIEFNKQVIKNINNSLVTSGLLSFDELIRRLSQSLQVGENKDLIEVIQNRFELALIDEFQDTDADQWHIFSTLFISNEHSLYLIGDPKQAIYKFRGADIFSYFSAHKAAKNIYSLDKNYRSHPALVDGVNSLFLNGEDPFLFKDKGLIYSKIAAGSSGTKVLDNPDNDGKLIYCQLDEDTTNKKGVWSSGKAKIAIKQHVLAEIIDLLGGDKENQAFIRDDGNKENIFPKDIAILVRSNSDALSYQQDLLNLGIPAIIAGRNSIFSSEECGELLSLLDAILEHDNPTKLKTALSLSLFDLSGNEIVDFWNDEVRVAEIYDLFFTCHQMWLERGILPMLYFLVEKQELFLNLSKHMRAERRIANFSHLFEILQQVETDENLGTRQTLIWLRTARQDKSATDSHELRLESDEEALKIVTVHSSKGLQYPIVFCPDLFIRSAYVKNEKLVLNCHDNGLVSDFGSDKFQERKDLAMTEELAELLRCAYVAITRAELACYVYWADLGGRGQVMSSHSSALAHLLFPSGSESLGHVDQQTDIKQLAGGAGCSYILVPAETEISKPKISGVQVGSYSSLGMGERSLHTDWQLTSYSALAGLSEHANIPFSVSQIKGREEEQSIKSGNLPKGARFGNALHDSLETFDFKLLAEVNSIAEVPGITRICDRYGLGLSDEEYFDFLELLKDSVNTPLTENGLSLSNLESGNCLMEMEFCLRLAHINITEINNILAGQNTVQPLSEKTIRGFMTGFVDLLFYWQGKYYILDYKSNFLGDKPSDYREENLINAMADHNYGLQYYIYSLVLHQHLQTFLPDYNYETHFGGVYYLFVRGMNPENAGSGVYHEVPDKFIIEQLDDLIGEAE